MEQDVQYAIKIMAQIQEMFNEDCENFIDINDFQDDKKLKDFLHALANIAPTQVFNKFTNDEKNFLEFNHVANHLCFEYSKKNED